MTAAAACTGCNLLHRDGADRDVTQVELRDDITNIVQYYPDPPWLLDNDGNAVGFKATVLFVSAKTGKGAFVPGNIHVTVDQLNRSAEDPRKFDKTTVQTWQLDRRAAEGFRVVNKAIMGERYGLVLKWDADKKLAGHYIDVRVDYERGDGRLISGAVRRFLVPMPIGLWLGPPGTTPRPARPPRNPAPQTQPDEQPLRRPEPAIRPAAVSPFACDGEESYDIPDPDSAGAQRR